MPIDFLGRSGGEKKEKPKETSFKWHLPEKEKIIQPSQVKVEPLKKSEPVVFLNIKPKQVNLVKILKIKKDRQRLIFLLVVVALIIIISFIIYFIITNYTKTETNVNLNNALILNQPKLEIQPEPLPIVIVEPQPKEEEQEAKIISEPETMSEPEELPDTELVVLKGALVGFLNDNNVYLINEKGELRKVDRQTVIFANGMSVTDISLNLIYILTQRYQTVRKGTDVFGKIDWDPRVLSPQELEKFIN